MCGRYWLDQREIDEDVWTVIDQLQRKGQPVKLGELFPSDQAPVVCNNRKLEPAPFLMRWGYSFPGDKCVFNARSETASGKPLFRDGMLQRRCLVPANWYFEWQHRDGKAIRHIISPKGEMGFYMAGIYHLEKGVPAFTILTREASPSVSPIHFRMPVILPGTVRKDWLNPGYKAEEIIASAALDMETRPG